MIRQNKDLFEKPPPSDDHIERGLIAATLVDPTTLDELPEYVSGADFYDDALGRLFDHLLILRQAREAIGDPVVLVRLLKSTELPARVTGASFVIQLMGEGMASNAKWYATQVRELAKRRRMWETCMQLLQKVHDDSLTMESVSSWLDSRNQSIISGSTPARSFKDVALDVLNELELPKDQRHGVMTGVESIDSVVGALLPGEVTILAARPGVGKTALAGQIAVYSSGKERPVLYVSLEMTERELVQRILCGASGVNGMRIRTRKIEDDDRRKLVDAYGQLGSLPLWLWAPSSTTLSRMLATVKVHHTSHHLRLLVVDYVGLVRQERQRMEDYEHFAHVSSGMKQIAKELEIPVLALCQLNREADKDEAPRLSQLARSGAFEQDADAVLFLHRKRGETHTDCIVAKNRHGVTGKFKLDFDAERTTFSAVTNRASEFDEWNER